jgi:hypothetical protein
MVTFKDYINEANKNTYKSTEDVVITDTEDFKRRSGYKELKTGFNKLHFYWKDADAYVEGNFKVDDDNNKVIVKKGSTLVLPYKIKKKEVYDEIWNNVSEYMAR